MNELDAIDLKILRILQKDGRITTLQLAERVGLSPTPCARRVRHLETEGFISQYVAVLNASKLNAGLDVFVSVRLRSQATAEYEKFERRINDFDEVVGCYLLAGNFDYLLHVKLPDVGSIAEFTRLSRILKANGVYSIGRYGGWTYCSIEDNIVEARALAAVLDA